MINKIDDIMIDLYQQIVNLLEIERKRLQYYAGAAIVAAGFGKIAFMNVHQYSIGIIGLTLFCTIAWGGLLYLDQSLDRPSVMFIGDSWKAMRVLTIALLIWDIVDVIIDCTTVSFASVIQSVMIVSYVYLYTVQPPKRRNKRQNKQTKFAWHN